MNPSNTPEYTGFIKKTMWSLANGEGRVDEMSMGVVEVQCEQFEALLDTGALIRITNKRIWEIMIHQLL